MPDYCHDLNAMHEVEKTLARDNVWAYRRALENQLGIAGGMASGSIDEHMFHATARQRAKAFLRVKGLWKEEA